jgi:glycerophosphoryl diester phosphodiesterase
LGSAYRGAAALGFQAIEAGDIRALSDGTLVPIHDPTVDATMTGTGNVNSFTKATWQAMSNDIAQVMGGTYPLDPAPLWDDALAALAGKAVIFPEVKDTSDATATAMCNRLDALGARDSAVITSFSLSNLVIAAGRGYKTMYVQRIGGERHLEPGDVEDRWHLVCGDGLHVCRCDGSQHQHHPGCRVPGLPLHG